jgi:hypothetical protein
MYDASVSKALLGRVKGEREGSIELSVCEAFENK